MSFHRKVNNDIIQIPPELIEDNLGKAPESFTLYGRNPDNSLELDRDRTYLSVDGCSSKTVDFSSGKRRASTKRRYRKRLENCGLPGPY